MKTEEAVHELFLNYACGAKCPFCYNPPLTPELLRRDLSFEQAAESLYAAAGQGRRRLNLHGGEVTLREDLPKILRLARKLGFEQATVVTNGIRLGRRSYAGELVAAGATHFRLSIHSADAGVHDEIMGVPGAFDKALSALAVLRELGAGVGLNFVLCRRNAAALPDFLERFCVGLAVPEAIVYFPHLKGMMALNADAIGLTYEEALPSVMAGAERLARAGRSEALYLANFPPCVLPDLAERLLDWERESGTSSMTHPEGFTQDLELMKDAARGPVAACADCALAGRCRGVEREYRLRYGEREFLPVRCEGDMAL
ncbi:MAG: radical SAM protein [Elusimicrobia bacterium]|nr:radical SAM protein [Elusimicrobiota bacterium]